MVSDARNRILALCEALYSSGAFGTLWPDVPLPKVYLGFPVNEPPFYVAVDEVTDYLGTTGAVSMGHAEVEWTCRVWCFAQHTSLQTASDALLAYCEALIMAVLADNTLGGTVDNAFPGIETAGTSADGSKRYIAAASVAVRCSLFSVCPAEIREVIANVDSDV